MIIGWLDARLQLISGNLFLSPSCKVSLIPQCLPHSGNGPSGSAEARHVSLVPSKNLQARRALRVQHRIDGTEVIHRQEIRRSKYW